MLRASRPVADAELLAKAAMPSLAPAQSAAASPASVLVPAGASVSVSVPGARASKSARLDADKVAALRCKLAQFTEALAGVPELAVELASAAAPSLVSKPSSRSSTTSSSSSSTQAQPLAPAPQTQTQTPAPLGAGAGAEDEFGPGFPRAVAGMITAMFQGKEGPASFAGKNVPVMSLEAYVDRIVRYIDLWAVQHHGAQAGTGARCVLMAVELISRLCDAGLGVCPRTAHRLVLAATLVAVKSTEDFVISNRFLSKVGGVPLDEMNRLEMDLCNALGWKLVVTREDMSALRNSVQEPAF